MATIFSNNSNGRNEEVASQASREEIGYNRAAPNRMMWPFYDEIPGYFH